MGQTTLDLNENIEQIISEKVENSKGKNMGEKYSVSWIGVSDGCGFDYEIKFTSPEDRRLYSGTPYQQD